MAKYRFGQLRRKPNTDYVTDLTYTLNDLITQSIYLTGANLKDKKISLTGTNILRSMNDAMTSIKSYYLKVKIKQLDTAQFITIKLFNTSKQEDNEQHIVDIQIPAGNDYIVYETIIKPNMTYNEIHFILNRIREDYNIKNGNYYGRTMIITIEKLQEIINLIPLLNIDKVGKLKQIGVQSHPGFLMSIDGEPIRIGRTGMYEVNYGVSVSFIGFIINDEYENFILDYQY